MKKQHDIKTDNGVVGIFTVVLIISLIVVVLGVVNTVYVPQWMKTAEFQHMNEVSNQFAQMKSALDVQSITNGSSAVSSLVTMGTFEIPFFGVHQSFDELSIPSKTCTILISNSSAPDLLYSTDSITFTSHNTNFVDQSYIYEAGALILNQGNNSVLLGRPSILVTEYGKNLTISFINVSLGAGADNFASGRGTYIIYSQVIENNKHYTLKQNVTDITIKTNYPDAWCDAFNVTLLHSNITNKITKPTKSSVIVNFIDEDGDYYNVFIREIKITADLAFGMIE
jgi:hypothetical protein